MERLGAAQMDSIAAILDAVHIGTAAVTENVPKRLDESWVKDWEMSTRL